MVIAGWTNRLITVRAFNSAMRSMIERNWATFNFVSFENADDAHTHTPSSSSSSTARRNAIERGRSVKMNSECPQTCSENKLEPRGIWWIISNLFSNINTERTLTSRPTELTKIYKKKGGRGSEGSPFNRVQNNQQFLKIKKRRRRLRVACSVCLRFLFLPWAAGVVTITMTTSGNNTINKDRPICAMFTAAVDDSYDLTIENTNKLKKKN